MPITEQLPELTQNNLPKSNRRLKLVILLAGIMLVFACISVGGIAYTMRSQFCSSCHEMAPEYNTWKASAHDKIGCVDCHIEPGIFNLMKDKLGAMVQVYKHLTVSYDSPIEYPVEKKGLIKNEQCLKCHSVNRLYVLPGDLIFDHSPHLAQDIQCVQCHSGVAHGNITERKTSENAIIPFDDWNPKIGSEQVAPKFANPTMDTCVACHTKVGQGTACSTCHKDQKTKG